MKKAILFLNNNVIQILFVLFFLGVNGNILYAQTDSSEKMISLQAKNKPIGQVFTSITKQTGLRFSYNPSVLNEKTLVSITIQNATVDDVLSRILPDTVSYKKINNYIIFKSSVSEDVTNTYTTEKQEVILEIHSDSVALSGNKTPIVDTVWIHGSSKNYDSLLLVLEEAEKQLAVLRSKEQASPSDNKGAWVIGISSGLRGEICFFSKQERAFRNKRKISTPPLEFSFGYLFDDKFFLGSGIKYISNYTNYSFETFNWSDELIIQNNKYLIYYSLQFPVDFKYYFHFGKTGLSVFAKAGINFSIPLQKQKNVVFTPDEYPEGSYLWTSPETGEEVTVYHKLTYNTVIQAPLRKVNILGNIGLGFSYNLKFGLGFSLSAQYYAGLLNMARIQIPYKQQQYNEITQQWEAYSEGTEYVNFRGDYWNFTLEISYKFKNRKD